MANIITITCAVLGLIAFRTTCNFQEGKPAVMEMYQKRSSILAIGSSNNMEWKQYVFIIKDEHLKYYRSNKVSIMSCLDCYHAGMQNYTFAASPA